MRQAPCHPVRQGDKWGFVSAAGRLTVELPLWPDAHFTDALTAVTLGGNMGTNRQWGVERAICKYDFMTGFSGGMARVVNNGRYGFMAEDGSETVACDTKMRSLCRGIGRNSSCKAVGLFLDSEGRAVIPCTFAEVCSFTEGLAAVRNEGGKWGYIDRSGKVVVSYRFDRAAEFKGGFAPARSMGCNTISTTAETVCTTVSYPWRERLPKLFRLWPKGRWGLVDSLGREIVAPRYQRIERFSEGPCSRHFYGPLRLYRFGRCWRLITPKYDEAGTFLGGYARVRHKDNIGFTNLSGRLVFVNRYDGAEGCAEGRLKVSKNGLFGLIDTDGNSLTECIYNNMSLPSEGLVAVCKGNLWGFIDLDGRQVVECRYQSVEPFNSGVARVCREGLWGVVDTSGRESVECSLDAIDRFYGGFCDVLRDGRRGYIARTRKAVIVER